MPAEFVKCESVMPSCFAYVFIICANCCSVPPTSSASATVASLPDCTIMPWIRLSTETCLPTSMNMREPSCFHACSLIVAMSVSLMRPSFSALKTP